MILAGEFEAPGVPPDALPRDPLDAGRFMKRAAYLNHTTAQFKSVLSSLLVKLC
jgi:TPR repeat protein